MGLPAPPGLDGQASAGLLQGGAPLPLVAAAPDGTNGANHAARPSARQRSKAEEEELRARLKGLGYL